jgi:Fur family ferric uptake transcriptional regulator
MGSKAAESARPRKQYKTHPREHIADILKREPRFVSAAEIHRLLDRDGCTIALSTVYRTLEHLQSKGEATVRMDAEGEATYMHCEPDRHHHHAICQHCGRVEDVACSAIDQFAQSLQTLHGFQLNGHAMEFFGLCRTCR